jgi:hypothetical protein
VLTLRSNLLRRLNRSERDCVNDVIDQSSARQVVHWAFQALQHRANVDDVAPGFCVTGRTRLVHLQSDFRDFVEFPAWILFALAVQGLLASGKFSARACFRRLL